MALTVENIKWAQSALNRVISAGLVVDGIMGPNTINAIKTFQAQVQIDVDGILGPLTESTLRFALTESAQPATVLRREPMPEITVTGQPPPPNYFPILLAAGLLLVLTS